MAILWSANECRRIASDLLSSSKKIDDLLNGELTAAISKGKNAYDSEAARSLFNKLESLKAKSADFIDNVRNCSRILTDEVAPAYEAEERKTASI